MNLETQILEAGKQLFLERGFNGTSISDIARRVGCNQALVHYYFRTKENLFRRIFVAELEAMLAFLTTTAHSDRPITEKLCYFVDVYFDFLNRNRSIPFLIMNELIINPERRAFVRETFFHTEALQSVWRRYKADVEAEQAAGRIRCVDPFDLLQSVISQTIFAFVSLPIYADLLGVDDAGTEAILQRRRAAIKRQITEYIALS